LCLGDFVVISLGSVKTRRDKRAPEGISRLLRMDVSASLLTAES